ncbi:GntR family transcriptional regulator [Vineibacter terrae]|uniref:GntR family transcriptional regulator n=1 Tax=Vineibacter terrae TaxID=2586908 RepID=UPI002E30E5D4|nr:GntR family transcriptional regulator [Vineibacter terrae]HEX2886987.1 GntR family transcriptional regulator [Vineibacter terrae]
MPASDAPAAPLMLARAQGSPLHHQVYLILRDALRSGRYRPGEMMPTEDALSAQFGVSRITIRRALDTLERANLIERRQGKGTYIRREAPSSPIHVPIYSIVEQIARVGATTDVRVIEFGYEVPPPDVREAFGLDETRTLQRAVRVRLQNGEPFVHLTTFVADRVSATFGRDDMERTSLFELIQRAGVRLHSGHQTVSATLATPLVSRHLNVKIGAPLLRTIRVLNDKDGNAVEHLEVLASPEVFQLRFALEPSDLAAVQARRPGHPE